MLLIASTCTGCLFGPPIEGIPEEPFWPPQIVVDQVYPLKITDGYTQVLPGGTELGDCEELEFRVRHVIDRNTSETLYTRWFINWQGPTGSDRTVSNDVFSPISDQSELRTDGDSFQSDSALTFTFEPTSVSNYQIGDKHTITFVIGDRPFGEANAGYVGTDFEEIGQYDIYQWHIEFTDGGFCDVVVQ